MAYDGSFDYDRLLSLDQAKLVGRTRINNLGAYELTLNYNKITSATKEDCLEYLEVNRLAITDPTFSNKTYDGEWKCVSIGYDEDRSIIQQIFKVDVSVGDLGDWDGTLPEPTWGDQSGDLSHISAGMQIEKAYYWRVTNPTDVNLPSTAIDGEIWTKTANDNGDGTYDVTVARAVEQNLTSTSSTVADAYTETSVLNTNSNAVATPPTPSAGEIITVTNKPNENGTFNTVSTTKTFIEQFGNEDSEVWGEGEDSEVIALTDILISGGDLTNVNQYYEHTAGTIGNTDAVWTGRSDPSWIISNVSGTSWTINSATYGQEAVRPFPNLNSSNWFSGSLSSIPAIDYYKRNLIVQIGFNPKPSYTETDISFNSTQKVFGTGTGEEPYPTVGQKKTISNLPLENGKFKSTVSTTTVNEQRVPALTDAVSFANNSTTSSTQVQNYDGERGALVVGKNATYASMQEAINDMNKYRYDFQNSVSFSINQYGLYDYTIRSADI